MSIRKIAAQAALLLSLFLIATIIVWSKIMGSMGSSAPTVAQFAQNVVDHKSLFTLAYFFDWVFALTTFILAAAYTQRFSRYQPWLGIVIGGTGVITAVLFLASGTVGVYGTQFGVREYSQSHSLTVVTFATELEMILSTAAVASVGIMTWATALASAKTKAFPKWVNWSGYICGIFYVAGLPLGAISMTLGMISMLGVVFGILFNVGVAMSFMRQPHAELTLAPAA